MLRIKVRTLLNPETHSLSPVLSPPSPSCTGARGAVPVFPAIIGVRAFLGYISSEEFDQIVNPYKMAYPDV
ncbi:hypothetical protein PCC7805_00390 [Planktothrix agardhii]|nr:hypothetical protein PCC7805_00390 [Planktothrix agardhii]